MEEIGLNDRFGVPIKNGCTVEMLVGTYKGEFFKCVWNIPQHRYGFEFIREGEEIQNPFNYPDNHFYATPKNAKNLKVI